MSLSDSLKQCIIFQSVLLEDGSRGDFTIPFCQLGPNLSAEGYARLSVFVNILQSTSVVLFAE